MPIRRAKSPATLYTQLKDYDLVLTPDAPLASAIARRLDRPHFGTFTTTPRRLAAGRREQAEDRQAFLEVIKETNHDWTAVAYAIGNVLQCWEHQGERDAIREYPAYVDATTDTVLDIMADLRTTSNQLASHTIDTDQSVAVVGYDQLTTLERRLVPETADRVDPFTDESFDLPAVHVFQSATDIVTALLDSITAETAGHVGIVLDANSRYSALVESGLAAADISFYGGPGFAENPHHRAFLRLLRLPFRGPDTTVGDVEPILTQVGQSIPTEDRHRRLQTVDNATTGWVKEFVQTATESTFADALTVFTERADTSLDRFRTELETLGLASQTVSEAAVDRLAYYLQTYQVPIDRDNEGVLLADATSSAYVDRPVVFYLGMDENWTHSAPERPWVDADAQFDRNIAAFQRLLQSGNQQYYLVQDVAGGEPVTPCLYFSELLDEDLERFSDFDSIDHRRRPRPTGGGFDYHPRGVEAESVETISQSSLNSYVNSPRDYLFGALLDQPDQERFIEGNLFHDFAEFYVAHPEIIAGADLDALIAFMLEETAAFVPESDVPLRRRKYRIGLELLMEYLDGHAPAESAFLTPASGWGENVFGEYFDTSIDSPLTERWFEDSSLGLKGTIDLVQGPQHLLDYKTGSKKRATKVVNRSAIDPPNDTPNFQAKLYLTYYRSVQPDAQLEFTFFHFLEPLADYIAGDADLGDALTTITYYPHSFDGFVGSRDAYEELLDGYTDCEETFRDLGFPAYSDIMDQLSFPDTTDKEGLRGSDFAEELTTAVDVGTSEAVDAEKGVDQAIRALNGVRKRSYFREDLDAFEAFIEERLAELNERQAGEERFPVNGLAGEPNYCRVDHRDLLLEGEQDD